MNSDEEKFKKWIMAFHKLRIMGFIKEREAKSIWKRIFKAILDSGYTFEDVGFYEFKFSKNQIFEDKKLK